ncbi:NHL repeat-containing protein [Hymenobacter sp. H14-R3]|uniref:NHL repeat-containing protein n=1 Tax=Hymenobacter sp. H14-R3 TaxID=3046308 RepID=UPI0024B965E8|nr:NHL repeat-containing protein [Hymenobacter sp. H14-R3]MDJ0366849.1 NHL repeat-containing protein [Hymenobacter sp. H14-R3]
MTFPLSRLGAMGLLAVALLACNERDDPTSHALTYTVSTLAGTGTAGFTNGAGSAAQFNGPNSVAVDAQGTVYVADINNNCIRKVTAAGVVSTLAGTGTAGQTDGPGATAQFFLPTGIAVDAQGTVYVADTNNNCIRTISPAGVVSTLAGAAGQGLQDGPAATAKFWRPQGLALDQQGALYVADSNNNRIRKITAQGVVSTVAGSGPADVKFVDENFADGPGNAALFYSPSGVAVNGQGAVYVADYRNNRIRSITPAGVVSTVAGGVAGYADGDAAQAKLFLPTGVAVDASGTLYVADWGNGCLRCISPAGQVSLFAGSSTRLGFADGPVASSLFSRSVGLAVNAAGTELYVADTNSHRIRKISGQ